ncbi:leucine-rich repeat extensin-like protein 3 [Iris pallida]|uniref:Leucine-rich repeat extensin-like protein 3 n=1 Tax=Iris pallida TaxID=29817 RepID=A0AAX6FKQ7_IRIPA|nr:leucine-rich repeat extensin-like protein 3 [Iris pallida]
MWAGAPALGAGSPAPGAAEYDTAGVHRPGGGEGFRAGPVDGGPGGGAGGRSTEADVRAWGRQLRMEAVRREVPENAATFGGCAWAAAKTRRGGGFRLGCDLDGGVRRAQGALPSGGVGESGQPCGSTEPGRRVSGRYPRRAEVDQIGPVDRRDCALAEAEDACGGHRRRRREAAGLAGADGGRCRGTGSPPFSFYGIGSLGEKILVVAMSA